MKWNFEVLREPMKWYFEVLGGHTHVRVFMNGGKCGDLCFRNEEFEQVRELCPWIQFIKELPRPTIPNEPQ